MNGLNWQQTMMPFDLDTRLSIETTAHMKHSEQALIEEHIASSEVLPMAYSLLMKLLRNVSSNTILSLLTARMNARSTIEPKCMNH